MAELDINDGEAAAWFAANEPTPREDQLNSCPGSRRRRRHRPRLHLVLGDSVAKRAAIASRYCGDKVLNRSQGGESWTSLLEHLEFDINAWQTTAAAWGMIPGSVVIWLTGNDVYSRESRMANFTLDKLFGVGRAARAAVLRLRRAADNVTILGPLPRLAGEVWGATWESTAAYHLERTLLKEGLHEHAVIIPLGRALTRKMGKRRQGLKGCEQWFCPDGVHLSAEGYLKLSDCVPVWLTLKAA